MSEQTEQEMLDAGRRVEQFLADAAVKDAIKRVADAAYEEFKKAETDNARANAWAKSKALDGLADELTRVMHNGKLVEMKRQIQAEQEERQRAADARRNGRKR